MNRKQAAAILGVNDHTLYRWERLHEVPRPPKNRRGHLLYTDEHVEMVRCIRAGEPTPAIKQAAEMMRAMRPSRPVETNDFMRLLSKLERGIERATMGDLRRLQDDPKARELMAEAIIALHRVGVTFGIADLPPVPDFVKRWRVPPSGSAPTEPGEN